MFDVILVSACILYIELGFTSDLNLVQYMHAKLQQPQQLKDILLNFGWRTVHLHTFIVGHTGVMLTRNADILADMRVAPSRVGPFLDKLAVDSLRKSHAILSCFPSANLPASASTSAGPPSQPPPPSLHLPLATGIG